MVGVQNGKICNLIAKRVVDVLIAGALIVLLSPLLLVVIVLLRLTGEGEVFYLQPRVGYKGSVFNMYKFVTMLKNSENTGGGTITEKNDPRVLPVGRCLRKTKINELPQLFNVLKGDMSIVGPRPQTPECFHLFPEVGREKIYLSKPGVTGIGSVVFRNEEDVIAASGKPLRVCYKEHIMPYKLELELWYLENRSCLVDVMLIALTALQILSPENRLYKKVLRNLPEQNPVNMVRSWDEHETVVREDTREMTMER